MITSRDTVRQKQLLAIARIIRDETWLEGERRGCAVSPSDPVVRENVCRVVLRVGAALRQSLQPPMPLARVRPPRLALRWSQAWRRAGLPVARWLRVRAERRSPRLAQSNERGPS